MSGFLYFIEGAKAATAEIIAAAGLGHALAAGKVTTRETTRGPESKAGIIAAPTTESLAAASVAYRPDAQTWTPIESAGEAPAAWLGHYNDDPPGPMDLLRPDAVLDGYIRVLDSIAGPGTWIIPRARIYAEDVSGATATAAESDLPRALKLIAGRLEKTPLPKYRQACLGAERIWAAVLTANAEAPDGETATVLEPVEEFEIAARILGINYRLAVPEINALEILTTANMSEILKAFVDFPEYFKAEAARAEAHAKKNDADGLDTEGSSSGPPDG